MNSFLALLSLFPLLGLILVSLWPEKKTVSLSKFLLIFPLSQFLATQAFILLWLIEKPSTYDFYWTFYEADSVKLSYSIFFDFVTAVYTLMGSFIVFLVFNYSRHYMLGEDGYKRYFVSLQLFVVGFFWVILAGQLDWLIVGWEILGLSSFLLISFYRERYNPVKNAFRVYSYYRLGDMGLVLCLWLIYQVFPSGVFFATLDQQTAQISSSTSLTILSFLLIFVALLKSAQWPFCSWLPRAMEGPTPSSAIFYGSLASHIGLFLLIRTAPLWSQVEGMQWILFGLGLFSAFLASRSASVQPTIKSQIAYSIITQIGLIVMEISLGLHGLALLHICGHAFLRTYQLLISPSIVSYLLREQSYQNPIRADSSLKQSSRWTLSLYVLALQEYNLDILIENALWRPFKKISILVQNISQKTKWTVFIAGIGGVGILLTLFTDSSIYVSRFSATMGVLFVILSLGSRGSVLGAWVLLCFNTLFILASVYLVHPLTPNEVVLYLSGIVLGGVSGAGVIFYLTQHNQGLVLGEHRSLIRYFPLLGLFFLLSCLLVTGFPISPTFLGEDMLFHHVHSNEYYLTLMLSMSYVLDGLASMRMYVRLFLGPEKQSSLPLERLESLSS